MRDGQLTSAQALQLASITELMDREWAPCRYNCPVHADVRAYIEHAAAGRFDRAIDVIRENLPFAATCGRICHHPCEQNCRRTDVDAAVAIREVKRFVAELQGAAGSTVRKAARQDKAKVAIVGGGPSGMSAALELAKQGYRPTVFEKFPVAGGVPATAVPKYRCPPQVPQIDIDWICAHGVELVTNCQIGKDKTIAQLKAEGFSAVLIAAGLAKSRALPLGNLDNPRVHLVMEFLTKLHFDQPADVGQNVIVIGGGNVAMDAARSAVRSSGGTACSQAVSDVAQPPSAVRRVRAVMLESAEEMPAWSWEQTEAREEGVEFVHRQGPTEIVVQGGKVTGIKVRKVTRVFDEAKRFSPQYDDTQTAVLDCDTVVLAIGQQADMGFLTDSGLTADARGRLAWSQHTHQTSQPDVFACGEIVTPPGSAVEACAHGKRAARAIDLYLSGKPIVLEDSLPPAIDKIDAPTAAKVVKVERQPVPTEPAESRRKTFAQMDHSYCESAALTEARRCMSCGAGAEVLVDKCAGCLTCYRVCPFDIPKVADVARIDSFLCQACGMCAAECPANAIVLKGGTASLGGTACSQAVSSSAKEQDTACKQAVPPEKKVVAFICGHHASAADWKAQSGIDDVQEVYLPSLAGLSTLDMLNALEAGASRVLVVTAKDNTDRYPQVAARLRARVQQARGLLGEIGLPTERVKLVELA